MTFTTTPPSLLIVNGRLVNEGTITEADLFINHGRIDRIGPDLAAIPADRVIDARGAHVLPGLIDDQVHFREPGLTHKGDLASESRAAVKGGVTSFMEMPNCKPPTVTSPALEAKYALAAQKVLANHAFYLGATNDNLADIQRLDPNAACGVKVFMGASTGNMLVDDERVLDGIFRDAPCLIATHCEDTPTILANEAAARERHGDDVPMHEHPVIRSEDACWRSSSMAVELAKRHGSRLHVLHITTAKELAHFQPGPVAMKRITAEACVHHLTFSDQDYATLGALIKCNPAIKRTEDREALRQAVNDDRIDVIATDHAPHTWDEKQRTYFGAPAGLPLVEYLLPALLDLVHQGVLDLPTLVHKTAHAPAMLYQIHDRGFLREGSWADIVIADLDAVTQPTHADVIGKCAWTPFDGRRLYGAVRSTIINGHVAWHDGRIDDSVLGQRLRFDR